MERDAYSHIHESLQRWMWLRGWTELRPIQENSFQSVLRADRDVIISAPTAGGKTEAAYFPILTNLLADPVENGYGVLNISPLKALINDQHERLMSMIEGPSLSVTPWHGDVALSVKQRSMRSPRGIVLITPESLESMFVNRPHEIERVFSRLRYVVIDEFHAFMGSERGMQVISLLSRLEYLLGRRIPRIAVSATLADYDVAASFLRPLRDGYPVEVPECGNATHPVKLLIKEYVPEKEQDECTDQIATDLFRNLRGSNNLVFANSRKEAETMALKLRDMCDSEGVPNEFRVHHGSLSKNEREGVEHDLKEGLHPVTAICTSTLELGVDIGKVKSIAQLVTANSVSALRQRLGRSGRRNEPSMLRIYSVDERRDDYKFLLRTNLVQNIAVVELLGKSDYERPNLKIPHFSTLVQQILSMLAQYGSFYPRDAWYILCRKGAFVNVSAQDFVDLLKQMGAKELVAQTSNGQIVIGRRGEYMLKSMDFYTAFVTLQDIDVVDNATGRVVGSVQYKPYVGEYILLGAKRWIVEAIDVNSGKIRVSQAKTTGKLMFEGFGAEVDGIITSKMKQIYLEDGSYPYLDSRFGGEESLAAGRSAFRELGLDKRDFIWIKNDPQWFTWGGAKVNRTISLMAAALWKKPVNYDPYAVSGITPEDVRRMLREDFSDPQRLVARLPRYKKEQDKHDALLPESLLDRQYAISALDITGALQQLKTVL